MMKDQRKERNGLRRDQRKEKSRFIKAANRKMAKLRDKGTAEQRNEHRQETKAAIADLADEHQMERVYLLHQQKTEREGVKDTHQQDWADFKSGLRIDAKSEGFKPKSRGALVVVARELAFSNRRTSKAGSAESILRHCLRSTGLSAPYRANTLTIDQHLRLLEEIRQYGRSWLRHEAGEFVRSYTRGMRCNGETDGETVSASGGMDEISRAAQWAKGPEGYLIQQDSGFRHAIGRFFDRSKRFVRELILAATLAISGPAP